jgi:hypothetical protein
MIIIDEASLEALGKEPFSSVKDVAKLTCILTTTAY